MDSKQAYNHWAATYDAVENKTRDLDAFATRKILGEYDFKTVLELGCGTGKNTQWLAEKANKVVGLDFSEEMLKQARTKIKTKNVSFIQADLTKPWQLENDWVDLVCCNLVLEHIKDMTPIFGQAHKKLKEGGLFFICELHPFKQYLGSKAKFETENGIQELDVYWHHISDYFNAANKNGFKLLELNEWFDNGEPNQIPRLISFVFQK